MENLSSVPAFGFVPNNSFIKSNLTDGKYEVTKLPDDTQLTLRVSQVMKIMGYIHVLGTLVGIYRIGVIAIEDTDERSLYKATHILRGTIELLSLGISLLIVDIAVTIFRAIQQRNNQFLHDPQTA